MNAISVVSCLQIMVALLGAAIAEEAGDDDAIVMASARH